MCLLSGAVHPSPMQVVVVCPVVALAEWAVVVAGWAVARPQVVEGLEAA